MIDQRAVDVYQVDLARNGFTDAVYIRDRVEEIGARLCNHCYTSPVTVSHAGLPLAEHLPRRRLSTKTAWTIRRCGTS